MPGIYTIGTAKTYATVTLGQLALVAAIAGNFTGQGVHSPEVYAGGVSVGGGTGSRYDEEPDLQLGLINETVNDYVWLRGMVINQGLRDYGIIIRGDAAPDAGFTYLNTGQYCRVSDITVTQNNSSNLTLFALGTVAGAAPPQLIERCMVHDVITTGDISCVGIGANAGGSGTMVVRNCMIMRISSGRDSAGIQIYNVTTGKVYSSSVLNVFTSNGAKTSKGFRMSTMTNGYVKNNISGFVSGGTPSDFKDEGVTNDFGGNNASEDATANIFGGSGNLINQNMTTDVDYLNVGSGTEDLHIADTSVAKEAGADLSGEGFTDDIDGDARPVGKWDIGADQITLAAARRRRGLSNGVHLGNRRHNLKTTSKLGV